MEKFSSSLNELASRVEASHLTTSQERELGIRQRDEQLRGMPVSITGLPQEGGQGVECSVAAPVLQERLGRQQRDMEEERSRLQEVVGKMEARLNEQNRLLEQVSILCRPPSPEHNPRLCFLCPASSASQCPSCPFPPLYLLAPARPLALPT